MEARRRLPKWEVIWTPAAETALLRMSDWNAMERAARAVHELSVTGRGNLRRRGTSQTDFSLYAGSTCIRLSTDRAEHRITIWWVFTLR